MSHIGELGDIKRPLSGWLSLVLFVLMIPLTNWVIMNVGLVCPADGPCLIPVWPWFRWASFRRTAGRFQSVLRDVVHHCLGWRWALISIFAGAALSGLISEPALVIASVCAFLFAELADFAVYAPMKKRYPAMAVIASGLAGSVVDSAIFLSLAFGSIELFGRTGAREVLDESDCRRLDRSLETTQDAYGPRTPADPVTRTHSQEKRRLRQFGHNCSNLIQPPFLYPMIAQNNTPKTAVLICNTGSPAAPTKEAVAKYLAEFLGDRRVVEMNPLIWQPILRGIIIPRRAQASADRYKTVWTQKGLLWWR